MSCGMGATAASATFGWLTRALSTSAVPMRCPETLITSSILPVIEEPAFLAAAARLITVLEEGGEDAEPGGGG